MAIEKFSPCFTAIIRKIFIRRGREKNLSFFFSFFLNKECYSCGVWHVHFALFEQLSIVYHWVGTWQQMHCYCMAKESDACSFVNIQNGKVSEPRYSNIYLLCDHLKRIETWNLTAIAYAIKSERKEKRKKSRASNLLPKCAHWLLHCYLLWTVSSDYIYIEFNVGIFFLSLYYLFFLWFGDCRYAIYWLLGCPYVSIFRMHICAFNLPEKWWENILR